MSNSENESDDDEFMLARYGTPMEELDDPEIPKKPIAVHEQIVTDEQGRRRFHGAFTGGFSAGYYNTVDTEEGWTPTSFRSSRCERKNNKISVPEDFMDDEDMSEFGIAPKKIVTQSQFSSGNKENDKKLQNKGKFQKNATMLLGLDMIQTLVVTVSNNIGTKLLQKMGWKPGQGIGPKVKKPKKSNIFIPENVEFAPEDCIPIEFLAKENVFGLGYTGMDPKKALHDKVKTSSEIAIRTKSGAKLSFMGQAFGVGAYEDEDQDIYAQDSMANYDLEMSEEKSDGTFGWSKPTKAITGTDPRLAIASAPKTLQNFHKAEKSSRRKIYAPPILPPDYDPFKRSKVMQKYGSFGAEVPELTADEEREKKFIRLDPNDRGQLLGEKPKIIESEKKLGKNDSVFSLLKPTDRQRLQILKHGGIGQPLPPEKPKKMGFYEPFASNPQKQERYEIYLKFLKMREPEPYLKIEKDPNMTEWEMQQEREEFMKSSRFFQPLSATMSSRFAPESESLKKEDEKEKSQKEAVKLKMFGILTRDSFEWHPDSLLCKRFNVPNPYPHSDITGIPGQDSGRMEMFLHPDDMKPKLQLSSQEISSKTIETGSKETGIIKDTKNPPLIAKNPTKSASRWDAKPREQLALPDPRHSTEKTLTNHDLSQSGDSKSKIETTPPSGQGKMDVVENATWSDDSKMDQTGHYDVTIGKKDDNESESSDDDSESDEKPERPPMDIFRAIFASSDSESSDSDTEEIMTRSSKIQRNNKKETSFSLKNLEPPEKEVDVNQPHFHKFSVPKKMLEAKDSLMPELSNENANVSEQCKLNSTNVQVSNSFNVIDVSPGADKSHQDGSNSAVSKAKPIIKLPQPTEQSSPTKSANSSNDNNENDDSTFNVVNVPTFHRFLPKSARTQKRPNIDDLAEKVSAEASGPPLPPGDAFGPALPPIKIPKIIDFAEKKSKKLKHKKKKHKKEKKKKNRDIQ